MLNVSRDKRYDYPGCGATSWRRLRYEQAHSRALSEKAVCSISYLQHSYAQRLCRTPGCSQNGYSRILMSSPFLPARSKAQTPDSSNSRLWDFTRKSTLPCEEPFLTLSFAGRRGLAVLAVVMGKRGLPRGGSTGVVSVSCRPR